MLLVSWNVAGRVKRLEEQAERLLGLEAEAKRELSWEWPRWSGGYRLDHLIVSASVSIESCRYEHHWRKDGLSDHSALIAQLQTS